MDEIGGEYMSVYNIGEFIKEKRERMGGNSGGALSRHLLLVYHVSD